MEIKTGAGVPNTEHSETFLQAMVNSMGMSFFKYGAVADAYPDRVDALKSLQVRLDKYAKTGNTEFLVDVANFAMIEFMRPKHKKAHYKPTDSGDSPGRVWNGEVNPIADANKFAPPEAA